MAKRNRSQNLKKNSGRHLQRSLKNGMVELALLVPQLDCPARIITVGISLKNQSAALNCILTRGIITANALGAISGWTETNMPMESGSGLPRLLALKKSEKKRKGNNGVAPTMNKKLSTTKKGYQSESVC